MLEQLKGQKHTIIAWLWARTAASPNPAANGANVPLVSSFMLSTKEGKKAWVELVIDASVRDGYRFVVRSGRIAPVLDDLSFDPFSFQQDGLAARREVEELYPVELVYSIEAYRAWCRREADCPDHIDLKDFRQGWREVRKGPFWEVDTWDELLEAISFLTLMNKRHVLYFRGQREHYDRCLPVLFREKWQLDGDPLPLGPANRGKYYARLRDLQGDILQVARQVGTPRTYILKYVPAAAASVLQHYELWPTHFIDLTRSLLTAIAFAEGKGDRDEAYLYVFAMPDLRGSITSDIDQHITLSRLEAICPPGAKRPHHQDAYLVSRFPEPSDLVGPGDPTWDDWQRKTDLTRRLVSKFLLRFQKRKAFRRASHRIEFSVPVVPGR